MLSHSNLKYLKFIIQTVCIFVVFSPFIMPFIPPLTSCFLSALVVIKFVHTIPLLIDVIKSALLIIEIFTKDMSPLTVFVSILTIMTFFKNK